LDTCIFSGLDASSFGTGTGVCSSATLQASFDAGSCGLSFSFAPDEFICGNTYLTQHMVSHPEPETGLSSALQLTLQ